MSLSQECISLFGRCEKNMCVCLEASEVTFLRVRPTASSLRQHGHGDLRVGIDSPPVAGEGPCEEQGGGGGVRADGFTFRTQATV